MIKKLTILALSIMIATTAMAYDVCHTTDEFDGTRIYELLDNNISGWRDQYEMSLNLQQTIRNENLISYSFVIGYYSEKNNLDIKDDATLIFLADNEKIVLNNANGYITNATNQLQTMETANRIAYGITGLLFGKENTARRYYTTCATFDITHENLNTIINASSIKFKLTSESTEIVQVLDDNDTKDLKQFYDEYTKYSSIIPMVKNTTDEHPIIPIVRPEREPSTIDKE